MCRGQAVGGVAKKSKMTGKMKLKPDTTLYQFCESFRLLQYAVDTLNRQTLEIADLDFSLLSKTASDAQQLLSRIYQVIRHLAVMIFHSILYKHVIMSFKRHQ